MRVRVSNKDGFSLVEVLVASGIILTILLAFTTMFSDQSRAINFLEFQTKREQLHLTVIRQFLSSPDNCRCLFSGAAPFPITGISRLGAASPTVLGPFDFATPGVCTTATIPYQFINSSGVDGLRSTDISIRDIIEVSGAYFGELVVMTESTKQVLGPSELPIRIRVALSTSAGPPGFRVFQSCSLAASTGAPFIPKRRSCHDNFHKSHTPSFTNTECLPAACAAGETNIDMGCKVAGDYMHWTGVSCNRLCYTGAMPAGYELTLYCPFGHLDGAPQGVSCTPSACPTGMINGGIYCDANRTGSNFIGGWCARTCIAN